MILKEHKHYVQGVCWDPLDQFVATNSSDRYSGASVHCIVDLMQKTVAARSAPINKTLSSKRNEPHHRKSMSKLEIQPSFRAVGQKTQEIVDI